MIRRSLWLGLALAFVLVSRASARPAYWNEMRMRHEGLQASHFELRPLYLMGLVEQCAKLADAYAEDRATVTAEDVRITRAVCIVAARRYVQLCIDAFDASTCKPTDGPSLARGVTALGALSADEQSVFAAIPTRFWLALGQPSTQRFRHGTYVDRDTSTCIEAATQIGMTPPATKYRQLAQSFCTSAAQVHDKSCVGAGARGCTSSWDRWEQVRDAARALAPLDEPSEAVFAHILGSVELADHRSQAAFDKILQSRAEKTIDTCAMLAQLRERWTSPEEQLAAKPASGQSTRATARRATFDREVREVYDDARATLDQDVEDVSQERAERAVAELACIPDHADAADLVPAARALLADVIAFQAAEAKCRETRSCQVARKAEQICRALADKRSVKGDVAREYHYAGQTGVVDVRRLGSNKEMLEALDTEIATAREEYRELAGKAFSGACKPPRAKWKKRMPVKPRGP